MVQIEWKESFSVNVWEIDDDHKILVRLFNDLGNAMRLGKGKERLNQILTELINYTKLHFAREEEIMRRYNYDQYEPHKKIHDDLKKKVLELHKQQSEEGFHLTVEVLFFLKNWLQDHILEKDKLLGLYLNNISPNENEENTFGFKGSHCQETIGLKRSTR